MEGSKDGRLEGSFVGNTDGEVVCVEISASIFEFLCISNSDSISLYDFFCNKLGCIDGIWFVAFSVVFNAERSGKLNELGTKLGAKSKYFACSYVDVKVGVLEPLNDETTKGTICGAFVSYKSEPK